MDAETGMQIEKIWEILRDLNQRVKCLELKANEVEVKIEYPETDDKFKEFVLRGNPVREWKGKPDG